MKWFYCPVSSGAASDPELKCHGIGSHTVVYRKVGTTPVRVYGFSDSRVVIEEVAVAWMVLTPCVTRRRSRRRTLTRIEEDPPATKIKHRHMNLDLDKARIIAVLMQANWTPRFGRGSYVEKTRRSDLSADHSANPIGFSQ
ncbi:hypothetical protein OPT61_g891 [Boeremia exigua]|uniref:Uncharacterized protein n=1 Tax=Boeremia exigua TaxID=749465 RepID=A0ACC2IS71_9PLEO|nr:hypothetical protein OPT61_g891 [Boeremia exigua]